MKKNLLTALFSLLICFSINGFDLETVKVIENWAVGEHLTMEQSLLVEEYNQTLMEAVAADLVSEAQLLDLSVEEYLEKEESLESFMINVIHFHESMHSYDTYSRYTELVKIGFRLKLQRDIRFPTPSHFHRISKIEKISDQIAMSLIE